MSEIELKFGVPDAAVEPVAAALQRLGATVDDLESLYWDSADGRLAAKRLALRLRHQRGTWEQTLKAPGANAVDRLEETVPRDGAWGADGPRPDPALHAGTAAGERLERALGDPAATLHLAYRSRFRRQAIELDAGGSRVELPFDQGTLEAGDRSLPVREVEIELKHGDAAVLVDFGRAGVDAHGMWLSTVSKAARGERLARSAAGGDGATRAVKARRVELERSMDGAAIFHALVAGSLEQVLANASELAAGEPDPEVVHQLRIGLRRLRTVWRELESWRGALPPRWEPAAVEAFRALGAYRDRQTVASALESTLAEAGSPDPVLRPDASADAVDPVALVRGAPFQHLLLDLLSFVLQPPSSAAAEEFPTGKHAAETLVGQRLDRLLVRLKRDAGRFERLDADARHRVRKRLKRLRYLAEMVRPLYRGVGRFLEQLEPAQDALGDAMDRQVAVELARERARGGHAGAWFNAGWLEAGMPEALHGCRKALQRAAGARPFWRDGFSRR